MGIIARLYANGRVYIVLRSDHGIKQRSDETGRPISRPFHTGLTVVIEVTKDTFFFEKAVHPTQQIQEIILEYTDSMPGSRTRRIRFVDCYVTLDHTEFKANGTDPLTETITITAAGIEDSHSQGKYTTPRRETAFLSEQVQAPVREDAQEGTILESYFEDRQGNRLDALQPYQDVRFVLKTENMEGETVHSDFGRHRVGFQYNGEALENNLLEDISISSGTKKVDLKTVKK
jgi:hypothetical protein